MSCCTTEIIFKYHRNKKSYHFLIDKYVQIVLTVVFFICLTLRWYQEATEGLDGVAKGRIYPEPLPERSAQVGLPVQDELICPSTQNMLYGITKNDVNCHKKSHPFDTSNLDFVPILNQNHQIIDHHFFPNTSNPSAELWACMTLEYPCQTYKEVQTSWNIIEDGIFRNVIKNSSLHSTSCHDEACQETKVSKKKCKINGDIQINLQIKNKLKQNKTYGGDYLLARMVPFTYPKYVKGRTPDINPKIHGTFIPGHIIDNKNGSYQITIPCIQAGNFRIQIFMIRTAETVTSLVHGWKTIHNKSGFGRFFKGQLLNGQMSEYCDSMMPAMLPNIGNVSNVCPIYTEQDSPGNTWYCARPHNGDCGDPKTGFGLNSTGYKYPQSLSDKRYRKEPWSITDVSGKLNLDDTYEELIFETNITVVDRKIEDASQKSKSLDEIPGYWLEGTWYDKTLPNFYLESNMSDPDTLVEFWRNKKLIRMGDSILKQLFGSLWKDLNEALNIKNKREFTERRAQANKDQAPSNEHISEEDLKIARKILQNISKSKSRKKRQNLNSNSHFDFLGFQDKYQPNCEPIIKYGAIQRNISEINHFVYTITHGLPFHTGGSVTCPGKSIFSTEAFERMIEHKWFGKNHIIILDHGAHLANWHPIIFYNRLIAIRNAAIKYKKHSPNSIIIYKTLNYIRGDFHHMYACTSSLAAIIQREIVFKILGNPYVDDIADDEKYPIKVFDAFPVTFVAFDQMHSGNVHPPIFLTKETTHMMFNLMKFVNYL